MNNFLLSYLPNASTEEIMFISQLIGDLDEEEANNFINVYKSKRREEQVVLLTTILGFFVAGGIQRFYLGQIGMGILYLLTFGLCFIGTIVDVVNYRQLTNEHNRQKAYETLQIIKMFNDRV